MKGLRTLFIYHPKRSPSSFKTQYMVILFFSLAKVLLRQCMNYTLFPRGGCYTIHTEIMENAIGHRYKLLQHQGGIHILEFIENHDLHYNTLSHAKTIVGINKTNIARENHTQEKGFTSCYSQVIIVLANK